MSTQTLERSVTDRAAEILRQSGNPFRNYFARNPDDEICARYHVAELYAAERDVLMSVIDLYRHDPKTHSEVVPILGNKGAGKTHLLHSIKHGAESAWQMLVTPGVYQKDSDFLEYLLFQIIDTLLGGGKQRDVRPLDYVGELSVRRLMVAALTDMTPEEKLDAFPAPGLGRWTRRLGLGQAQAVERCQWLLETVAGPTAVGSKARTMPLHQAITEAGLTPQRTLEMVNRYVEKTESHNTAGMMRRAILQGMARACLTRDESSLADFLTFGFAELDFHVRPSRQDLVLSLLRVLMDTFRTLKIPVVVAFDQLEDLLLARRSDDGHKIAEAFFAGIVQVMHQIDGLCILIFAERGLWNRFVPSLDGYIQDRLNNPVHVPRHGTIKALRLEAPPVDLVRRVAETRLAHAMGVMAGHRDVSTIWPFTEEQLDRIARTEPTLRDMLQQYRHLFDHLIFGHGEAEPRPTLRIPTPEVIEAPVSPTVAPAVNRIAEMVDTPPEPMPAMGTNRIAEIVETPLELVVRSVEVVQPAPEMEVPPAPVMVVAPVEAAKPSFDPVVTFTPASPRVPLLSMETMQDLWAQEQRAARRKLEPDGALTGATRELQAGLGAFLRLCHEHGVKVGPWRLQHVVPEYSFGEHPTYGAISIAHWACKDGQPWRVGIGLFLAKGAGKPRDLEVKLTAMNTEPAVIDHLILLRPEDDMSLTGKSKTLWADAEKQGKHARLEPVAIEGFSSLYSFPRWMGVLMEAMPEGQPLPNLADLIQDQCEKLLEQVCMPVTG